ncbi:hypothetical protein ACTXT7_003286 [Hymenolepis weldensis]
MVFGAVRTPHLLPQGLRVNADADVHVETLQTIVVKPLWIDSIVSEWFFVFQGDLTSSHKALKTQDWMVENLHLHVTPNLCPPPNSPNPPNSQDLDPLDYYAWLKRKYQLEESDLFANLISQIYGHIFEEQQKRYKHTPLSVRYDPTLKKLLQVSITGVYLVIGLELTSQKEYADIKERRCSFLYQMCLLSAFSGPLGFV